MDTIYTTPVKNLYYDREKEIMWSPEGLGADDRAGIFAIIKIIQSGLRPSIILTVDEEKGGLGASALAEEECPIENLKYLIELDRRGTKDCVFYNCCNEEFINYIQSFGFIKAYGSFSDISFLCPEWKKCGTNLSVGYENEHSLIETICISDLLNTIEKVQKMLTAEGIPDFLYQEFNNNSNFSWPINDIMQCSKCNHIFNDYELIPIKNMQKKTKYYCSDCITGNVDWCDSCGEPYEVTPTSRRAICENCALKGVKEEK